VRYYLSLKDLYYNGIPDRYDLHGNKIRGVPPDPKLAIFYTREAIKQGYVKGWIDLAQMYHYGFYDFPSDLGYAERIYQYIVDHVGDPAIVNQAYALYREAHDENETIRTHAWLNLPYTRRIQPKKTQYELGSQKKPKATTTFDPVGTEVDINTLFRTNRHGNGNGNGNVVTIVDGDLVGDGTGGGQGPRVVNDMHNVHDHSVISTIKQSVDRLRQETPMNRNNPQCLNEIRQYLSQLPDNDKKRDAIFALDTIEKSYLPLSFTELTETDALALVWNRIHSDVHQDKTQTLRENLADELAECIEHDKPVCATGRFTRILDTLNMTDPGVSIKSTFMTNEEMMAKAGKIREQEYTTLQEEEKNKVDDIAPNPFQKQWASLLKEKITTQLHDDYVKTDIMTKETFDKEVAKWIDEI
jgi:hypothetical protein